MPETERLKIDVLKELYESHKESPFATFETDSLVEEVLTQLDEDVEASAIDYAVSRLDEQYLVDYDPAINSRGTIELTPRGVEELQQEIGGTFLGDNNRIQILSELEELEREEPGASWDGESFRDNLDLTLDVVDLNMWYLIKKGWVDATWVISSPPYTALQLSSLGRQGLEQYRSQGESKISTEQEAEESIDVCSLVQQEESVTVEFKETFLFDVYQEQPNTDLKEKVAKEVGALANTEGGKVVIGLKDEDREVIGIERDLSLMSEGKDEFERQINQEISTQIGNPFASLFTRVRFEEVDDAEVCIISVDTVPEPVYCGEILYVRNGSSSVPLDTPDAVEYIDQHWSG